MQVRVITMRYNEAYKGFSEDDLRGATFGREVLSVETHFFMHGNVPHLSLVLTLADREEGGEGARARMQTNAERLEEQIPEASRPVYLALKDWRNRTARERGVPAYSIGRNAQLAELVLKAPKTMAAIREIRGFGDAFCREYGEEVLKMLADVKPAEEKRQECRFPEGGDSEKRHSGRFDDEGGTS